METLKLFSFGENQVRIVIGEDGNPLFVASDVAKVLGYKRPKDAISAHCKGAVNHRLSDNHGVPHDYKVIPESDVYRLVFRSKMPRAEKFEEWVVGDVLPSIRKTRMN